MSGVFIYLLAIQAYRRLRQTRMKSPSANGHHISEWLSRHPHGGRNRPQLRCFISPQPVHH